MRQLKPISTYSADPGTKRLQRLFQTMTLGSHEWQNSTPKTGAGSEMRCFLSFKVTGMGVFLMRGSKEKLISVQPKATPVLPAGLQEGEKNKQVELSPYEAKHEAGASSRFTKQNTKRTLL